MLLNNNKKRAKSALNRWFKIACDPVALIKLNRAIPNLYDDKISNTYFFNKWKIALARKQADNMTKGLGVQKMFFKLDRYWKRRMKVNFLCWRDMLIEKNDAVRTLYRFANDQRYCRVMQAFEKWHRFKEDQDFNVRL